VRSPVRMVELAVGVSLRRRGGGRVRAPGAGARSRRERLRNFQIAVHRGDEPAEVREAEVVFEIDLRKVVLDDRADVVRVAALDLVLEARERVFGFSQSVLAILLVERLLEVDQAAESC